MNTTRLFLITAMLLFCLVGRGQTDSVKTMVADTIVNVGKFNEFLIVMQTSLEKGTTYFEKKIGFSTAQLEKSKKLDVQFADSALAFTNRMRSGKKVSIEDKLAVLEIYNRASRQKEDLCTKQQSDKLKLEKEEKIKASKTTKTINN